jgi:hypothetical protein
MDGIGYGRYGGSAFDPAPNVLIDLAKYAQGQGDALSLQQADQQNALMRLKMDAEQQAMSRDASFRAIAPGLMQGNPEAFQSAIGIDPERAAKLRSVYEGFGDDQRKRAMQNMELMGQGAASLLTLPDDQAAPAYAAMLDRFRKAGIDTASLPAAYPGRAAVEQFTRALIPVQQQLQQLDARPRPAGRSWLDRIKADESGGDPNARNPLSSAAGSGQFINSTWQQFAQAHPDLFQGMTPEQVLAARSNPDLMDRAIMWYRGVNERQLSQSGVEPTDANLALSHRFGSSGAVAIIRAKKANPATPMASVVTPDVLRANPDLASRTVGDVVSAAERRHRPAAMTDSRGVPITQGNLALVQGADGQPTWVPNQAAIDAARQTAEIKQETNTKPLPAGDRKTLLETGGKLSTFEGLSGTFEDRFGGFTATWAGDIANWIQRNATGDPSGAQWWSTYQELKNQVRNDLFGAALTAAEKSEFEKSAINPGMRPEVIKAYLGRQQAVLRRALDRHAESLVTDGYRREAVATAMGRQIGQRQAQTPAPEYGQIATNPQTGQRIRLNLRTNQWEPM